MRIVSRSTRGATQPFGLRRSMVLCVAILASAAASADEACPPTIDDLSGPFHWGAVESALERSAGTATPPAASSELRPEPDAPAPDTPAPESKEPRFKVQREKIYFGDEKKFSRPATLEASKVYEKIPSYRRIVDRGLTRDDPEYWPLMRKASAAFVRALKTVCAAPGGYDLVGEIGSIQPTRDDVEGASVPEITDKVIAAVEAERELASAQRKPR